MQQESVSHSDLPMVVWLEGDEPWFEDFSLAAEEVMDALGIKRSRLTQISGQELRVGRKRVERYVKPFYRSADVEQYKSWTRATASHQKSSALVTQAAEILAQETTRVSDEVAGSLRNLNHILQAWPDRAKTLLREAFAEASPLQIDLYEKLTKQLRRLETELTLKIQDLQKQYGEVTARMILMQEVLQDQHDLSRGIDVNLAALKSELFTPFSFKKKQFFQQIPLQKGEPAAVETARFARRTRSRKVEMKLVEAPDLGLLCGWNWRASRRCKR